MLVVMVYMRWNNSAYLHVW